MNKRIKKKRSKAWFTGYVKGINSRPCDFCTAPSQWVYSPGEGTYCDNCVPRGCFCTDGLYDLQGRPLPCCEYESLQWTIELHGLKIRLD